MKILHAVRSDAFAGVESHVARVARAQLARGDEVVVIGGDVARMAGAIGPGARIVPGATVGGVLRAVRRAAPRADIVHAHMTAAEIACAAGLLGSRTPVVTTRHFARVRGSNPASVLVGGWAAGRVSAQIAISRWVADSIRGESVVIHPGVDVVTRTPTSADRERMILVAQRLEGEKETDIAVKAFARSGLAIQGWHLEIAGGGSRRADLEMLAASLGIARSVRFLGHRSDVGALMLRAGVLLAPCRVEGLGLTVLEAMASALPVVAVGSGGHLETVGSVPGAALHAPGDVKGAATLLRELCDDPGRRDTYGVALQAAQRECFTPEHQAARTAEVYRAVM